MSIPSQVIVKPSSRPGSGLGVFAQQMIPRGVKVGPYVGRRVPAVEVEEDKDTSYIYVGGIYYIISDNYNLPRTNYYPAYACTARG